MNWETITTLVIGGAMGTVFSAIGAYISHRFTRKRDIDTFNRESLERHKQHMAALFSEALAVGMLLVNQRDTSKEDSHELDRRKCTMLGMLRLEAGNDIANQWGAYVGASQNTGQSRIEEQDRLEEMMRNYLAKIDVDLARSKKD
jgi:hypothetical protein